MLCSDKPCERARASQLSCRRQQCSLPASVLPAGGCYSPVRNRGPRRVALPEVRLALKDHGQRGCDKPRSADRDSGSNRSQAPFYRNWVKSKLRSLVLVLVLVVVLDQSAFSPATRARL